MSFIFSSLKVSASGLMPGVFKSDNSGRAIQMYGKMIKPASTAALLMYMGALLYISTLPLVSVLAVSPAGKVLNNLAHIPAYALLTLFIYVWLELHAVTMGFSRKIINSGAAAFFFGAFMEILQKWAPGRTFSRKDILLNAAGVLLAAASAVLMRRMYRVSMRQLSPWPQVKEHV